MRPVRSTLSRRVRGVLSPYREGEFGACAPANGGGIPARTGMTGGRLGNGTPGAEAQ